MEYSVGVGCFILFPKVPDALKTNYAEEAYNPNGIVPRALSMIKSKFPHAIVCTDIALGTSLVFSLLLFDDTDVILAASKLLIMFYSFLFIKLY